jgi:hypothetical protein
MLVNAMGMDMAIGEGGGVEALFKGTKSSANVVSGLKNLKDKMRETENTLKAGAGPGAISFFEKNKKQLDSMSPDGEALFDVAGRPMNRATAISFIKDNANNKVFTEDPRYKALKKQLGL